MTLTPCDSAIFRDGTPVFVTHTIPAFEMERWVRTVAVISGQPVDWSYFGGRAVVRCLGDVDRVIQTIRYLKPVHDAAYRRAVNSYGVRTLSDGDPCEGHFLIEAAKAAGGE